MISPDALIPSLRNADPAELPEILDLLELEQIKTAAHDICGMKRIGKDATAEGLRGLIAMTLKAERALTPERPALGALVLDEESGEEVEITEALGRAVMELSHRLQQAEFSAERAMVEICTVIRDFRKERAYLYYGYTSFRKFCDVGQLKVFGQTRSRRWADRMMQIVDTLGYEVGPRVAQLPQRQLLKLAQVLNSEGMETALEKLKNKLQLTDKDDSGQEVSLALPENSEDVKQWSEVITMLHRQAQAAKRGELAAEDTLVSEREAHRSELAEYSKKLGDLEEQLAEMAGRGENLDAEIEQAKEMNPEAVAKLIKDREEVRTTTNRIQADLVAAQDQTGRLAEQIEKHQQLAAAQGTLKITRAQCEEMIRKTDEALDAVKGLRAMGADLPAASLEVLRDSTIRCESQFRQLADELTYLKEDA